MWDTVFGLPLHVLLIHAAVVVVPLVAVGSVVVAARQRWRSQFIGWAFGASVGCVGIVVATVKSGRRLAERLPPSPAIDRHAALGSALIWLTLSLCLTLGAITVWSWLRSLSTGIRTDFVARSLLALLTIVAVAVCVQVVRVGHSGSGAVWGPIVDATSNE
jgi:hypothetical protein